ncbi:ATP-binding protein [Streptomyces sp. NPDC046374]|uniref:wHTH domain-containing protein n=1 Tax=Streptomyces sp. NPDC046374 TaxID=3154917 RepID=UPI0033F42D6F
MEQGWTRNVVDGGTVGGPVVQAGSIGVVHLHTDARPQPEPAETPPADPWVRAVGDSAVWKHVAGDRDARAHRELAEAVAARLAGIRAGVGVPPDAGVPAEARVPPDSGVPAEDRTDPWDDPGLPTRFLEQVEWLLGEPGAGPDLDLYPAEAALLALFPFLYRAHCLLRVEQLAAIAPWSLAPRAEPSADRRAFEVFTEGDEALVQRARRDAAAEPAVGWWLFHRWLAQQREFAGADPVRRLLDELGATADGLGEALAPRRVTALLHGLRRGPDVCHPEFLTLLPTDDRARSGPGHQRIRDQRLALLLALAHGMAVEMTALPSIVAEHLPIPYPVDLDALRRTLDTAHWGGPHDHPVLRAECRHEAVVEGLREYTARADELLHTVRRTARDRITQPLPELPTRLSSDGVVPSEGAFDGYARFRGDGRRVLDLAMGIQLYKSRDLAVRELYQNALDACRYRRARGEYLDRTGQPASTPYLGRIAFVQDVDEDGREYLECQDDGVGMGDAELRGVFSRAGSRFAEQLEFTLERAAWERLDPPVTLYPNSRFGIGVLSYFMLADDIRVTTCRMGPDGVPGPVYEVSVCGPGHLFRIVQVAARGREPGTRVRLYLRPDTLEEGWSSVDVLERVLGIAEFPTGARHGGGPESTWVPGVLRARHGNQGEDFALNAHGSLTVWPDAPEGVDVVWCEQGGALLVDGLLVEPQVRHTGIFGGKVSGLTGAVVNLSGSRSPGTLSVDRRHVVDDVAPVVGELLRQAAGVLADAEADRGVPGFEWVCRVAKESPVLADIVTSALAAKGRTLTYKGLSFGAPGAGFLPMDFSLLPRWRRGDRYTPARWANDGKDVDDHIYLWRLLARRHPALEGLEEVCPGIRDSGPVLRAVPSDQWILRSTTQRLAFIPDAARSLGSAPRELARRMAVLGFAKVDPRHWAPDALLTQAGARAFEDPSDPDGLTLHERVTADGLQKAATRMRSGVDETAAHLRRFGFTVPEHVERLAAASDELLVAAPGTYGAGLLDADAVVPPGHIAEVSIASGMSVPEVCRRLAAYGLAVDPGGLPERPSTEDLVLLSARGTGKAPWLDRAEVTPPGHLLQAVKQLGLPLTGVLARLKGLGFTVPDVLPPDAGPEDLALLTDDFERVFLTSAASPLYAFVLDGANGLPELRRKVARLRSYGFEIALDVPSRPTALDREILRPYGPFNWWTPSNAPVPFTHVVMAARELGTSPRDIAKRLRACGITPSHDDLPPGVSFGEATDLLRLGDTPETEVPEAHHFSLQYLHHAAIRRRTTLTEVVDLIRNLGVPLPHPADTIRAALARVPRPPCNEMVGHGEQRLPVAQVYGERRPARVGRAAPFPGQRP